MGAGLGLLGEIWKATFAHSTEAMSLTDLPEGKPQANQEKV